MNNSLAEVHPELASEWSESFLANGIMNRINGNLQRYHELQQRECGGNAGTVIHWCVFCLPFL